MSFVANFIGINKYANQSIGINSCPYFILIYPIRESVNLLDIYHLTAYK